MNERVKPQGCALRATAISGRLQGLLGEITIAQTYQNTESVNIEAVFTFPVPVEAVLLGVDIRIDDRLLQGRVLPRRQAENAYEDAVSGGDSAILLQEAGRGLYTVNVGNLLPGQTARLCYRYALLSVWNGDTLRLQLPTTIAPRYGDPGQAGLQPHQIPPVDLDAENRFSLELELGGSLRQAVVESPSHRINVEVGVEVLRVRLAGGPALMDRDFILNIRGSTAARAAFGLCAPDRNGWITLASVQPELSGYADAGGRDCVLIADCSGSMAGDSIAQTRAALLAILDRLQPTDRFNLIAFGSQPRAFFTGLHPADDRGLAQARALVAGLDADMGGTEIGAALQLAYRQHQGQPLDILLMADGEAWNAEALAVEAQRSGCRVFTVGVGAAVAEGLVRGVAWRGGGDRRRVRVRSPQRGHGGAHRSPFRANPRPARRGGDALAGFARWLEANAARLADPGQPLPTLDELAHAGLPGDLLARLRELVAQGETEDTVMAALLHAFLQHGPERQLPRNVSRAIRARCQKQVSATLAVAVEPLVKTWCATG